MRQTEAYQQSRGIKKKQRLLKPLQKMLAVRGATKKTWKSKGKPIKKVKKAPKA
jgi:hypothetical protein